MQKLSLVDFLPMLPWEGPPLPRFLGIYWPNFVRANLHRALPEPPDLADFSRSVETREEPLATYANEESWSIEWNEEGLPTKVVVHRNAKRSGR